MEVVRFPRHASLAVAPGSLQGKAHSSVTEGSPNSTSVGGALSFTCTVRTVFEVTLLLDGSVAEYSMVKVPGVVELPLRLAVTGTLPAHTSLAVAPGST